MERIGRIFTQERLEQFIWFILLLSWIPFLYGQNIFLFGQTSLPILLPEHASIIPLPRIPYLPLSAFGPMTFFGFAATVAALFLRDKRFFIPILYILAANFIYVFNGSAFAEIDAIKSLVYWVVLFLFFSSVIIFLIHGHILSSSFSLFACLLFFDAIIFNAIEWWTSISVETRDALAKIGAPPPEVAGDPFSMFSLLYGAYRPSFGLSLLIVLTLVLIRAFFLTWQDNKPLLKIIDTKILTSSAITTVRKLWWPMPVVFVSMSVVWFLVFDVFVERQVICVLDETQFSAGQCNPKEGVTFETTLDAYTQIKFKSAQAEITKKITDAKTQILETSGKAPNETVNAVNKATRGRLPGTTTERCGFLNVICYIKNGVKSSANRAYQKGRSSAIAQMRNNLAKLDQAAIETAGGIENATLEIVNKSTNNIASFTASGIGTGFAIFRAVSFLLALYSILILIKTFLIVFARVLFDPDKENPTHTQFMPGSVKNGQGDINVRGSKVILPKSLKEDRFYGYSGMRVAGFKKDRSFPLGARFFLGRFFSGRTTFLRVPNGSCDPAKRQSGELNLNVPAQIVEWKLIAGEQVFFRFADLQGFSSGVTFHRKASMSISTLIFGRVILYYAEGPGTILLRTAAAAEVSGLQKTMKASEPETFVAWGMPLAFYVDAKLDWLNTFLSSINLKVQTPGHFVKDTDDNRVSSIGGILRFVTQFLLPI